MRVAVIGGGVAGLAAARRLAGAGAEIELFEAGWKLGGRVSTGRHGGAAFDDGAQFLRPEPGSAGHRLIRELPARDLASIAEDVAPFDASGRVSAGDPAQNAEPKLVYEGGLSRLATLLAAAGPRAVRLGWAVRALSRARDGWRLTGPKGVAGPFDAVVLTTPGPVAVEILAASAFDVTARDRLTEGLRTVTYRAIVSVAFGLASSPARPLDAYALVNVDRGHAVSWLAFEHMKPGYAPPGLGVVVAQMADTWSRPRFGQPDRELVAESWAEARPLAGLATGFQWAVVTRWPHALPNATVPAEAAATGEPQGLYLAGDALAGPRAHRALESGLDAAGRLLAAVGPR